ncbi:ankyrin repeat-containing domain protein [Fusarium sp. MPI-SDFR-AT-0072]|nr:ankyrin repeat-containing domain protein [Fusarium sp. MPI-SDFR-AT-0072]
MHDDVEMEIGTLTSSQTVSTDAGFKIEFPILAQTPINVGTDNAYRNSNTLGAVLVMKNPVVRSSIEDGAFLDRWFKENQRLFPEIRSAVREHGVWLVTTTYTTEEIALNVWQDKDKVVKLGFSVGIDGIVNLEPSIERGEKKHADGSLIYRAKSDEKLVSFVGGIRFHYRSHVWTTGKLKPGVAYLQDPRTYHFQEWTEAERVGTEGKHVEAQKSGKGTVTEDTETVHGASDDKDAEPNMKQIDEDSTSESSARSEVETDDDALQDKEDQGYSLTDAVHDGNADRVRDALGRKSEDMSQKEDYEGLLKDACAAGYADIVDLLIKASADTNDFGGSGPYTPLIAASESGHARVVQILLGAGADPDISDNCSNALFAASKAGHDDVVLWLLAAGADVDQLASRTSALQVAAEGGHDQCVRWLIAAGADLDQQAEGTALYRAARKGYLGIIQQLLVAGADVDSQEEHGEKREEAPLHAAAASGRLEVVECLLNAGADVNACGGTKETPIAAAAASGCAPVVKLLLDKLEASGKKRFGAALAYAVQKREAEIVDMLLAAGASPDGDPEDTMDFHSMKSPLIIAVQAGNEDLVARLIKAGANVDQYFSQYGRSLTPLYAASMKGRLAIMRQLLDAGATVDGKAGYLGTPLLAAVSEGHVEVMTLLLDAGADLQARSAVNKYPALVVALDKGHPEVVENLINAGANVNDSAEYYGSALQAAAFKGYRDVAEKLLDVGADPAMEGGRYGLAIFAAAAKQRVDVVKMFIDRRVVTKEQAKKAKDRVEEMIESGDDRSTEFHEILEILSSVVE